jgi:hypothetical protein
VRFVVDKVVLGHVFSEYFGLFCQFSFHQLLYTHLSSRAGKVGQLMADVPSGLSLTPSHITKEKELNKLMPMLDSSIYSDEYRELCIWANQILYLQFEYAH